MSTIQTVVQWVTQYPFTVAALFFGGAVVAVTPYTYVYDYQEWLNQEWLNQDQHLHGRRDVGGGSGSEDSSEDTTRHRRAGRTRSNPQRVGTNSRER